MLVGPDWNRKSTTQILAWRHRAIEKGDWDWVERFDNELQGREQWTFTHFARVRTQNLLGSERTIERESEIVLVNKEQRRIVMDSIELGPRVSLALDVEWEVTT